jgi:uncharacterized protein (DUF2147 family)
MPIQSRLAAAAPARRALAFLIGATLLSSAAAAAADESPAGTWRVEDGKALIRIVDCGGKYWGVVAWEKTPGIDRRNPNPALRTRPTLGMPVLLDMSRDQANQWKGRIYNAEDGQTYESHVRLSGANALRVEGCVLGFMCGGETWTRAAANATQGTERAPARTTSGSGHAKHPIATESVTQVCSGIGRR